MSPNSRLRRLRQAAADRLAADRLATVPTPVDPEEAAHRLALEQTARTIEGLGVVDLEFYSTLVGVSFESVFEAAVHYLEHDNRRDLTMSPLIEPQWFALSRRKSGLPWYDALATAPGLYSTSPSFDPAVYRKSAGPEAAELTTTLALLRHFLAAAGADTVMPFHKHVQGGGLTWGAFRARALQRARRDFAYAEGRRRRWRETWDAEAETAYRAEVAATARSLGEEQRALVSVILPTKDRRKKLAKAVHSLQQQSYRNWEAVIVDDGSTDGSGEYLAELAAADPRVRVLANTGSGVASARNTGIAAATGDYVAFLDSDNTWRPDHLLLSLAGLASSGARSSHAGLRMVNTGPDGEDFFTFRGEQGSYEYLLAGNFIDMNVLVLERSLLDEVGVFDPVLERWVDYDLVLRLAQVELPVYLPFLALDYDNRTAADRISVAKPMGWQDVVLARYLLDWTELRERPRVAGRLSIVMPTFRDWRMVWRAVESIMLHSGDRDLEVIVVDNGSTRPVLAILESLFGDSTRYRVVRAPRNLNFALGSDYGFAWTSGDTILMLNNDTQVTPGWLDDLLEPLADPAVAGVQPLLLYPDGSVQAAGTVFGGEHVMPWHFLAGHPVEDVLRAGVTRFSAATGAALLLRAADFAAVDGFDPLFTNGMEDVDLCLRLLRGTDRRFALAVDSVVYHYESRTPGRATGNSANRRIFDSRWSGAYPASELGLYERAGFLAPHYRAIAPTAAGDLRTGEPVVIRPPRAVETGPFRGEPSLRWAIKTAAHAGRRGAHWGDTIFANDLRVALEALGQEVVVDPRLSHYRSSSYLDDVVLTLRGLERVDPQPGIVNVLWIISHPELVTDEEILEYDLVYCASAKWAAEASARTGRSVLPLLQATDPARFFADAGQDGAKSGIAFVGTTRNEYRPIVRSAVDSGADISIYGPGWEQFVPAEMIKADSVAADRVGELYRGASVVLADHWADMAEHGFISNRLFDAVASGTVVVSDSVDGIAEIFGPAVRVVEDVAEVGGLLTDLSWLPERAEMLERARIVRERHSFTARAETLLRAALDFRRSSS